MLSDTNRSGFADAPSLSPPSFAIRVRGLNKKFGRLDVLRDVEMEIQPGELTVLIGPSGCGKSTFLRCLNGLERMDSGSVELAGLMLQSRQTQDDAAFEVVAKKVRQKVGMVFQQFHLFPHMTVLENCMRAPMVVLDTPSEVARARSEALLKKVGLGERQHHYPAQLSGGQQQRAAIARALAMEPQILLYDEPTSSLDPTLTHEVLQVMKQLDQEGMTQVVATHEMKFARDVADTVAFFHHGRIHEMGAPEQVFDAPKREETREFLRHF